MVALITSVLLVCALYGYGTYRNQYKSPPSHPPAIGTQIPPSILTAHVFATTTLSIHKIPIVVYVARSPAERELGLGGRKGLASSTGMLFVFDINGDYGFWMKDMQFDIDIVWIDENKRIVHVESNVLANSYPQVFRPTTPALYVLELPAGFVLQHKIALGDSVLF